MKQRIPLKKSKKLSSSADSSHFTNHLLGGSLLTEQERLGTLSMVQTAKHIRPEQTTRGGILEVNPYDLDQVT